MSLEISIGVEKEIFEESVRQAQQLLLRSPVLSEHKFEVLMSLDREQYANEIFPLDFDPAAQDLRSALAALADAVVEAVRDRGTVLVVLSDRGLSPDRLQISALMATGAVHHRLTREGLRCKANIVVDNRFRLGSASLRRALRLRRQLRSSLAVLRGHPPHGRRQRIPSAFFGRAILSRSSVPELTRGC